MKKRNNVASDERTRKETGKASAITLALIWVALIVICFVKTLIYGNENITEEVLVLVGSLLVFTIARHWNDDIDFPTDFLGRPLPSTLDKDDKKARIKAYAFDAFVSGAGLAILNVVLNRLNKNFDYIIIEFSGTALTIILNFLIETCVFFVIFMLMNYFSGEHNVKKYNKMMEEND